LRLMLDDLPGAEAIGKRGRAWAVAHASPAAVGATYDALLCRVMNQAPR
jgi:hypothetical protein